jgi:hypothetical protein
MIEEAVMPTSTNARRDSSVPLSTSGQFGITGAAQTREAYDRVGRRNGGGAHHAEAHRKPHVSRAAVVNSIAATT